MGRRKTRLGQAGPAGLAWAAPNGPGMRMYEWVYVCMNLCMFACVSVYVSVCLCPCFGWSKNGCPGARIGDLRIRKVQPRSGTPERGSQIREQDPPPRPDHPERGPRPEGQDQNWRSRYPAAPTQIRDTRKGGPDPGKRSLIRGPGPDPGHTKGIQIRGTWANLDRGFRLRKET